LPAGAKLVIGSLITLLVINAVSLYAHTTPPARDVIAIVVQIALLTGLYNRQVFAWHAARWLTALAIACDAFVLVVAAFTMAAQPVVIGSVLAGLALASGLFYLLGRDDSRAYFNAPRKA
jgi:hypothetical protein